MRVFTLPLGKEAFAGPAVPSGLCREFPLGTGCAESIWVCAEWSSLSAQPQIPVMHTSAAPIMRRARMKVWVQELCG
jgi:hypothetical protein